MNYLSDDKPIVACSTGLSENTAIGIVRLSGFDNLNYVQDFFKVDLGSIGPRIATFCKLYFQDKFLDEVVITFFKGPSSYNGENILEISAHGNIHNLKRIINCFVSSGLFRLASNGEFTYRALKNKKLSLSQVEGLDAVLNASSSMMLDQGLATLNGKLNRRYNALYDNFLKLKSSIEINIDFAEDVGEEESKSHLLQSVKEIGECISSLYRSSSLNSKALMSPDIVLVGNPNSGKSSLFNKILSTNRSIVTDIAGTTRDYITEYLTVGNNTFRLVDTAGLRVTTDEIEKEGIARSIELLGDSFFKILLIDIREFSNDYFYAISDVAFDLIVFTHCAEVGLEVLKSTLDYNLKTDHIILTDLVKEFQDFEGGPIGANLVGPIEPKEKIGSIGPVSLGGSMGADFTSGPTGALLINESILNGSMGAKLKLPLVDEITQLLNNKYLKYSDLDPIFIERHICIISNLKDSFDLFSGNINNLDDMAIISSECQIMESMITELIGFVAPDDILDNIFSNFCIGK